MTPYSKLEKSGNECDLSAGCPTCSIRFKPILRLFEQKKLSFNDHERARLDCSHFFGQTSEESVDDCREFFLVEPLEKKTGRTSTKASNARTSHAELYPKLIAT